MMPTASLSYGTASRGGLRVHVAAWWLLTILGCLALMEASRLPWTAESDSGDTVLVTGFNSVSVQSGQAGFWDQLHLLSFGIPDATPDASSGDGSSGDGSVVVIPGLSALTPDAGGSDSGAMWGIFVFVPAAIALFVALWTVAGERAHRRSMARVVFILGGLTIIPLLHDLFASGDLSSGPGQTVGAGIIIGLASSLVTMGGSACLYRSLRDA